MNEINIQYENFPYDTKVNEAVTLNEDGSYTVFLNARQSSEGLERSYLHALEHINNDDFFSGDNVQSIEARAHRGQDQAEAETQVLSERNRELLALYRQRHEKSMKKLRAEIRRRKRKEDALKKLGYQYETVLAHDKYGCPCAADVVVKMKRY